MSRTFALLGTAVTILSLAGVALALGFQSAAPPPADDAVGAAAAGRDAAETTAPAHEAVWEGYIRAGPADRLAHTRETEMLVMPLARMGFEVEVPEGTQALALRLEWPAGTRMHLMAHGPHEAGMPTYMSGWPSEGEACIRIPADAVTPGVWKVMAHAEERAVDLSFRISVLTEAPLPPRVLDGLHGHALAEDMPMEMREPEACEAAA